MSQPKLDVETGMINVTNGEDEMIHGLDATDFHVHLSGLSNGRIVPHLLHEVQSDDVTITRLKGEDVDPRHNDLIGRQPETLRARLQAQKGSHSATTHEHQNHGGRKSNHCPQHHIRE